MSVASDSALAVGQKRTFLIICLCFLLSGFAALLYETVWLRQFAIILGTSEQALAVILGAYMGGLSFGAWIASRTTGMIRRPLLTYGVLEAGIAACALAMPLGLLGVQALQVKLFGGSPEPPSAGSFSVILFGMASAFALILPPTAMMGATLPLLAKYAVRNDRELGPRIGLLYAINTFGAVAGTLAAAFVFLPALGLGHTTWVGAGINLGIFVLIWLGLNEMPMRVAADEPALAVSPDGATESAARTAAVDSLAATGDEAGVPYRLILWFIAISGAVSFGFEIVFTRMLGHMLGGSIFAFATMLAGFLLGIAIGGAIASRLATARRVAAIYFVYAQALTGIFALAAFWLINQVSAFSLEGLGGNHSTLSQVVLSMAILLPSATCIGATFPLAIRVFAKDERDAARGSAKVYFWNTIGAIIGSLLTGMFLLPYLAYHGSTILAIVINASLAMALVAVMRLPKGHALAGVVTLVCLLLAIPTPPENVLRVSALPGPLTDGDFFFNEVGRSATVTVFAQEGFFRFQTNGLPEAAAAPKGAGLSFTSDGAWLTALPPLLRPGGKSMLIVGLGGGTAASFVPPSLREADVFELEPAVVEANRRISDLRARDPLSDHRIKIILNDGRNGLALTSKQYDYIVSQPSHPWTAGASHLYTLEFNQIVRNRLLPGGVFLQWMDMDFVDLPLTRSMVAGLLKVFPHLRIYEPTKGTLLFVSSDQPIEPEKRSDPKLEIALADQQFYREFGIIEASDLIALLRMDEAAVRDFVGNSPPITDEFNLLAMRAPRLISHSARKRSVEEQLHPWEPAFFYPEGLEALCPTIDYRAYAVRVRARTVRDFPMLAAWIKDPVEEALMQSTLAQFRGEKALAEAELYRAVEIDSNDPRPAYMILSYGELGTMPKEDEKTIAELESRLDDRYRQLYEAVLLLNQPDNQGVPDIAKYDELLASFGPNEIGYELASRLRMIWRISDTGPYRVQLGAEALQISREASPTLGPESLAFFEILAAIQANEPHVALSTVMNIAKSLVERAKLVDTGEITVEKVMEMFPLLARCRSAIANPNDFRGVPTQRYRETILFVDNLLAGYPGGP